MDAHDTAGQHPSFRRYSPFHKRQPGLARHQIASAQRRKGNGFTHSGTSGSRLVRSPASTDHRRPCSTYRGVARRRAGIKSGGAGQINVADRQFRAETGRRFPAQVQKISEQRRSRSPARPAAMEWPDVSGTKDAEVGEQTYAECSYCTDILAHVSGRCRLAHQARAQRST